MMVCMKNLQIQYDMRKLFSTFLLVFYYLLPLCLKKQLLNLRGSDHSSNLIVYELLVSDMLSCPETY